MKCKICSTKFDQRNSRNIYCSKKCKVKADMIKRSNKPKTKICQFCNKEFIPYTSLDKFCSANCRINNQKSKRSSNWNPKQTEGIIGNKNPAYRNGFYTTEKKKTKTSIGEREFIKNSKELKKQMIDDVGYIYCQHTGRSDSIKYETHHIIFRSEKPHHPQLHKKKNLIVVSIEAHNEFHKNKRLRDELVEKRGLDKIFGNDILLIK